MSHTKKPGFFARLFGKKPVDNAPPFNAGQSVEFTNTAGDVCPCTIKSCVQQGDGSWCCVVCFDSGAWQGKCGGVRASDLRAAGMSKSIVGAYFVGTDVLVSYHSAPESQHVLGGGGGHHGHHGGYGGPPVMVPGMVYPLAMASEMLEEADVIGEVERVIGEVEHVLGHGGRHGGRGWGRGFGWGYPYGPPLDFGYTAVDTGQAALADAALAEAIQKNTELQRELDAAKVKKTVVGHRGGGAQGFYRGGWFGGDYPAPFAYVGPYEDVDTALEQSGADAALTEALQQNTQLQRDLERSKLEQAAKTVGGDFEDFDRRMVRFTGKMRGGR